MYDSLRMIPFTLTADEVAAATLAAQATIWTGENADTLVRVPMLLVLSKPAGDAFTVAPGARIQVVDEDGNIVWSCNAVGFLDQATAQSRVLKPVGNAEAAANYLFTLYVTGTVSVGTASPALHGRMFYDQVQIGF